MKLIRAFALFLFLLDSSANVVWASVKAQLVSEKTSLEGTEPITLGIYLQMDKGWHVYWINPGDSGLATSVAWKLPRGFHAKPIQWPSPERFVTDGNVSYGYAKEVLLLVDMVPANAGETQKIVKIGATVKWLACKDTCIPGQADLALSLPVNTETAVLPKTWKEKFNRTRGQLPKEFSHWQLSAQRRQEQIQLTLSSTRKDSKIEKLAFFPQDEEVIDYEAPQILKKDPDKITLQLKASSYGNKPAKVLRGILVSSHSWSDQEGEKFMNVNIPIQ